MYEIIYTFIYECKEGSLAVKFWTGQRKKEEWSKQDSSFKTYTEESFRRSKGRWYKVPGDVDRTEPLSLPTRS